MYPKPFLVRVVSTVERSHPAPSFAIVHPLERCSHQHNLMSAGDPCGGRAPTPCLLHVQKLIRLRCRASLPAMTAALGRQPRFDSTNASSSSDHPRRPRGSGRVRRGDAKSPEAASCRQRPSAAHQPSNGPGVAIRREAWSIFDVRSEVTMTAATPRCKTIEPATS
jgi:hypothetical protein